MVYYNEIDPHAAAWLRELIADGQIANGEVDERDIRDVTPDDLRGYTQCHFFAGLGGWSYALRQAGWPDDRPVWTGSCPCQPLSSAGARKGFADERHLWPAWHHLIRICRPPILFGEQVASKDALSWLDLVQDDLEGEGYAVGAVDLCAASVGSPHIRQRLWFVADTADCRCELFKRELRFCHSNNGAEYASQQFSPESSTRFLANPSGDQRGAGRAGETDARTQQSSGCRDALLVGDPCVSGLARRARHSRDDGAEQPSLERTGGPTGGFWADACWIYCKDGKYRPSEPGTAPLVDGTADRVGSGGDQSLPLDARNTAEARKMRLKGYGNAIVAPLATEFIRAYMDTRFS